MARLMISVSGVRGVYGDGLDDGIAERFAFAFGKRHGGPVVMGRDSRVSGPAIAAAVASGLRKAGADVIDLGLASTPTTEMAVTARKAAGGVIITASHNPGEWNGLKFLGPDGVFISPEEGERLVEGFNAAGDMSLPQPSGELSSWDGADDHHIDSILALDVIDPDRIARAGFNVCLDAVNGAGGSICVRLLESLGCSVRGINLEPTGVFPRGAEPVPENLGDLCALVSETSADIGFAADPDVDRLSLVNGAGIAPGEEYTLAIAADFLFGKGVKASACNLSTSRMIEDAAALHGASVFRSAVGEINVVNVMRENDAGFGGEGNGGVIYPPLHEGRDAVLGMALILQYMAESGKSLAELAARLPRYAMVKDKIPLSSGASWRDPLIAAFPGAGTDLRDGVRLDLGNSWVHVRPSNTEPIIRIIAEAPDRNELDFILDRVRCAVR